MRYRLLTIECIKQPFVLKSFFFFKLPFNYSVTSAQFRTTNNNVPVNGRRFEGIARNERICHKCDNGEIEDEYYYLFSCPFSPPIRKDLIPSLYSKRRNALKLFSASTKESYRLKLVTFLNVVRSKMEKKWCVCVLTETRERVIESRICVNLFSVHNCFVDFCFVFWAITILRAFNK